MLSPVSVREIMVDDVVTVGEDVPIEDATTRLREEDLGAMVVVEDGAAVGMLTERDLLDAFVSDEDPATMTASDAMTESPVTAHPDDTVEDAVEALEEYGLKRLPVVEDDRLAGIVTTTDLSYYLPQVTIGKRPGSADRPPGPDEVAYEDEDWETEFLDADRGGLCPGDRVQFSKTLSEEDVETFAEISGDTNRLHLEEEFAEDTRFGERIVHGSLVTGIVSAALARIPGLTIYLSQSLSFREPVPVGGEVTAVCEVVEDLDGKKYGLATRVYQDSELVADGEATVVIDEIVTNLPAK